MGSSQITAKVVKDFSFLSFAIRERENVLREQLGEPQGVDDLNDLMVAVLGKALDDAALGKGESRFDFPEHTDDKTKKMVRWLLAKQGFAVGFWVGPSPSMQQGQSTDILELTWDPLEILQDSNPKDKK